MLGKDESGLEVSGGAGGVWAKVSGREAWLLLVVILVAAVTALLVTITLEMQQRKIEHQSLAAGQSGLQAAINKVTEAQAETTYVLTLSPAEREKLKLQMPSSLWKKLRGESPGS